ncbi:MAG: hypothetical protein WD009_11310 [Phycisphaeraceae bacterium]
MQLIATLIRRYESWCLGEDAIAHLPKVERRRIAWGITSIVLRHPLCLICLTYLVAVFMSLVYIDVFAANSHSLRYLRLLFSSGYFVIIPLMVLLNRHVRKRAIQRLIDAGNIYLDYCLHCHYDLRGTSGDRCPECGAEIHK